MELKRRIIFQILRHDLFDEFFRVISPLTGRAGSTVILVDKRNTA